MLSALIGAGASILGSLFGGDDEKTTTTEVDYSKMAYNAEKAGFNPLTAIRNGGSAGFVTTHHPGLSAMERFGNAFSTLGNALMSFDPRADERADMEQKLMQAQLDAINRGTGARSMWSMDAPSAAAPAIWRPAGSYQTAGGGFVVTPTPATSADTISTQYGDWVSDPWGMANFLYDVNRQKTLGQPAPSRPVGKAIDRVVDWWNAPANPALPMTPYTPGVEGW